MKLLFTLFLCLFLLPTYSQSSFDDISEKENIEVRQEDNRAFAQTVDNSDSPTTSSKDVDKSKSEKKPIPDLTAGMNKNTKILLAGILVLGMIAVVVYRLRKPYTPSK